MDGQIQSAPTVSQNLVFFSFHCPFYRTLVIVHYTHRKGTNPVISKEELSMKYNAISNSEKFWEIIYASVMLEGKEREEALQRLQVPANPAA